LLNRLAESNSICEKKIRSCVPSIIGLSLDPLSDDGEDQERRRKWRKARGRRSQAKAKARFETEILHKSIRKYLHKVKGKIKPISLNINSSAFPNPKSSSSSIPTSCSKGSVDDTAVCIMNCERGDELPIGLVCHVGYSKSLAHCMSKSRKPSWGKFVDRSSLSPLYCGISVSTCGHYIHQLCAMNLKSELQLKVNHEAHYEGMFTLREIRDEFLCPYCKHLANCLLPIFPKYGPVEMRLNNDKGFYGMVRLWRKLALRSKQEASCLPSSHKDYPRNDKGLAEEAFVLLLRQIDISLRQPLMTSKKKRVVQRGNTMLQALRNLSLCESAFDALESKKPAGLGGLLRNSSNLTEIIRQRQRTSAASTESAEEKSDVAINLSSQNLWSKDFWFKRKVLTREEHIFQTAVDAFVSTGDITTALCRCAMKSLSEISEYGIILYQIHLCNILDQPPEKNTKFLRQSSNRQYCDVTFNVSPEDDIDLKGPLLAGLAGIEIQSANHSFPEVLECDRVKANILLFLRRFLLLMNVKDVWKSDGNVRLQILLRKLLADEESLVQIIMLNPVLDHIPALCDLLNLPSPHEMQKSATFETLRQTLLKVQNRNVELEEPTRPPALINLPQKFHDLYIEVWNLSCAGGVQSGIAQAMCLLCGELICLKKSLQHEQSSFSPCQCSRATFKRAFVRRRSDNYPNSEVVFFPKGDSKAGAMGPLTMHSYMCNGGDGCFIQLKQHPKGWHGGEFLKISSTIIVHDGRCATSSSLYIDEFGQVDLNFVRGRPLTLCKERLEQVKSWVLNQTMPTQVCKRRRHYPFAKHVPHDHI